MSDDKNQNDQVVFVEVRKGVSDFGESLREGQSIEVPNLTRPTEWTIPPAVTPSTGTPDGGGSGSGESGGNSTE